MNSKIAGRLQNITHIVLKFGTGVLTEHIEKRSLGYFRSVAKECRELQKQGKKVIIVSSGAVGFGRTILKERNRLSLPKASVSEKQALASLGQSLLIDSYRNAFAKEKLAAAQILVTRTDFENKLHRQNLKATLNQLLDWGAVPVINENDAIANEEIKVGDNDNLSADIALLYPKSLLVLLTTVDAFYRDGKAVPHITKVSPDIKKHAGDALEGGGGTGGMITKLQAADKILAAGQLMSIAAGKKMSIVRQLVAGESVGTWFYE
ncbi:MAG: glutamate 5-kinase [Spirochaetes bacterium]|nr:glutamate 5-kinase [Spirochaetota bacterium]